MKSRAKKRQSDEMTKDVEVQNNVKKKCLTSKDVMTTSIQSPHRKNYTLFFFKFNNFSFDNLVYVNLSNNGIFCLPKQFGALPFLWYINLSRNCLGAYDRYRWLWIEQAAIGKSLWNLDMSYNSLKELPLCIDKLHALKWLNISHNILQRLSHRIGNLSNLKFLNISYNRLLFLPSTIMKLKLSQIIITNNPYSRKLSVHEHNMDMDNLKYRIINMDNNDIHNVWYPVPSLKELSANIIREHRIKYDMNSMPRPLVIYLDAAESCNICRRICIEQNCHKLNAFNYRFMIRQFLKAFFIIVYSAKSVYAQIETYRCLSCCAQYPIVHIDDVLNGILT